MSAVRDAVIVGADGLRRCWWAESAGDILRQYHDREWGVAVRDDQSLFEHLCLEGFQAGLSWTTVLHKRNAFRAHFANFDIDKVARFGHREIARMMEDPHIIRNRAKIEAAIGNAVVTRDLVRTRPGALVDLIWSHAPAGRRARPRRRDDIPAITPQAEALSTALRAQGFRFVGPTTMYALMQSAGLVNDHVIGCFRAAEVSFEPVGSPHTTRYTS